MYDLYILDGKKNLYYDGELDDNFTSAICANENLFDEIRNNGFECEKTHFSPIGIKTNAPINKIKNILKKLESE